MVQVGSFVMTLTWPQKYLGASLPRLYSQGKARQGRAMQRNAMRMRCEREPDASRRHVISDSTVQPLCNLTPQRRATKWALIKCKNR